MRGWEGVGGGLTQARREVRSERMDAICIFLELEVGDGCVGGSRIL